MFGDPEPPGRGNRRRHTGSITDSTLLTKSLVLSQNNRGPDIELQNSINKNLAEKELAARINNAPPVSDAVFKQTAYKKDDYGDNGGGGNIGAGTSATEVNMVFIPNDVINNSSIKFSNSFVNFCYKTNNIKPLY